MWKLAREPNYDKTVKTKIRGSKTKFHMNIKIVELWHYMIWWHCKDDKWNNRSINWLTPTARVLFSGWPGDTLRGAWSYCCDVIMGAMASQITSLTIVYSTVHSGVDKRKHQSSASLAFVRQIHQWPVNSPHKWPVTRKMLPFGDVIMMSELIVAWWRIWWHKSGLLSYSNSHDDDALCHAANFRERGGPREIIDCGNLYVKFLGKKRLQLKKSHFYLYDQYQECFHCKSTEMSFFGVLLTMFVRQSWPREWLSAVRLQAITRTNDSKVHLSVIAPPRREWRESVVSRYLNWCLYYLTHCPLRDLNEF